MKIKTLKLGLTLGFVIACASLAQAQQRFGDNLGNHRAATNLDMNTKAILNTSGIAIGRATFTNESVALEVDGTAKAIVITRVADLSNILEPLAGMIVFNTADSKFYVYNGVAWISYALQLTEATGANIVGDVRGYTLAPVGDGSTELRLSPATATQPGIIIPGDQEFTGSKKIFGNFEATGTLIIGEDATLSKSLTVAGDVTIGTDPNDPAAIPSTTTVNAPFRANDFTILAGAVTRSGTVAPGVVIADVPVATDPLIVETSQFLVVGADGSLRKSTLSAAMMLKNIVPIVEPVTPFSVANQIGKIVLSGVADIKANDGIVVNFDALSSQDLAEYLTITNAIATGDGEVTVWLADLRQPQETDPSNGEYEYTAPVLTGKNLVVTRYRQAN